ncbi:hypothetical protein AUQ48_15910 [Kocuria flava]|uniref:Uncharacterized protein n=1 Tax=Kocuria flava TaxID=446860 RepID=A0A2N4SXZ2_9MICC|nr:hypothetical protein AUQ48_15910 [Kocuria flava]
MATRRASEASWLADCIRPASWSAPTVSLSAVIVLSSMMKARLTFLPDASGCFSASMARMPGVRAAWLSIARAIHPAKLDGAPGGRRRSVT